MRMASTSRPESVSVEDAQPWLEHGHLEDLVALLLAAGEALVDAAVGELAVELYYLSLLAHELDKLAGVEWLQTLVLALGIDGGLHEVGHRHAGYLDGILEGEEESLAGAVFGLHVQEVLAVEDGFALGNGVERVAGKDGAERGLARTVGAHDGMDLTVADGEIDAS